MRLGALALFLLLGGPAHAETVRVAVAANFTATAEQLSRVFAQQTGHELLLSSAATGQLYAQIVQGAPFDIFLAADAERPALAVEQGSGIEGSVFTYATGVLALYSTTLDVTGGMDVLSVEFDNLAIADPQAAPYGRAALEVLSALGLAEAVQARLVIGDSITQALQFVETGNAELGFVAASQVLGKDNVWIVPTELYQPIAQDAVLLERGVANAAAGAFMQFLRGETATEIIEAAGYRRE
ncbi:molybdate ABC transporter substrate-binding protein [Devosia sp. RR2S18]|uniref:molybdate ABC transporter substrate-binding protein n=1 Tax=Devosia rhizosphaerae TaxID=3049774 RepID=UPI002540F840|nr:molybdate ABC transporter substrate-binding protein [Devosia sp. RR2S18]WIJ25721.1 molybdate ABC transporter substrate-binding protein [Devosia sp. RR2S18]